jgi:hypothetical protein
VAEQPLKSHHPNHFEHPTLQPNEQRAQRCDITSLTVSQTTSIHCNLKHRHQITMSSSSQATTRSNGLTLFSLSAELRNMIYRAHFDELFDADLPRNKDGFIFATAVRSFLNVFEVSRDVYAETHGMFFAEYFTHSHYALEGLRATQAFIKLPSKWRKD